MAIEIKGLTEGVARARSAIQQAREATDQMGQSVRRLVETANEIAQACDKHRSDLEFEATQLGNAPPVVQPPSITPMQVEPPFPTPGAGNSAV